MICSFLTRAYVPVATLLLTVVLTTLLANWSRPFDPSAAAHDPRLQTKGPKEMPAGEAGTPPNQEGETRAVLNPDPVIDQGHEQLLYLGNSQTTMIVDAGPSDLVTAQWLQVLLERRGIPVAVHLGGAGGMTMAEIFLRLAAGGEHRPREADVVVISAAIDEFRKLGTRDEIAALAKDRAVKSRLEQLCRDNPDLPYATTAIEALLSPPPAAAVESPSSTIAQRVESRLQRVAEQWAFLAQRDELNAEFVLTYLRVRDGVFGITPASLRPLPETAYRANLQLLELACRYARAQGIRLIVYLSPVRNAKPSPDAPEDLEKLRRDLLRLCGPYGAVFLNYTEVVPEKLWSKYAVNVSNLRAGVAGQPDFVHLTGAGHRLLAERLLADAAAQLNAASQVQARVQRP